MKLIGFTCTYNEEEYIPYVMPYVEAMGYDKFVVFDNGSTDRTVELLKKYPFVEVREYTTGGKFDDDRKCGLQSESFFECKQLAWRGELVCMTWTDFDEVLLWNGDVDFKTQLKTDYIWRGYNCFYKNMINVLPPHKHYKTKEIFDKFGGFVHAMPDMRGSVWVGGMKPTMYIVNDFVSIDFYPGNHYAFLTPKDGVEIKNYDDTCRMYGFHLKFIDKEALRRKTKGYADRGLAAAEQLLPKLDEVYNKHLAVSFPMENYFLQDFFYSKLASVGTPYDGAIKKGES